MVHGWREARVDDACGAGRGASDQYAQRVSTRFGTQSTSLELIVGIPIAF
jgi:hypothetical protein